MTEDQARWLDIRGKGHVVEIHSSAVLSSTIALSGTGHTLRIGPEVLFGGDGAGLVMLGSGHKVEIGRGAAVGLRITLQGSGNRVEVEESCHLVGVANLLGSPTRLSIGSGTTMVDCRMQLHEPGEILIGSDCMISNQVYVSLSDIHPIYDQLTGERINPAASVSIGDHVWLGLRSMIMKGANIGQGAVVAAGAIITGTTPSHAVVTGAPLQVLREGIVWARDFDHTSSEGS